MSKFTIELINPSVEIAMCDLTEPSEAQKKYTNETTISRYDYVTSHVAERTKLKDNWMNLDNEVRWFERDNAGHINGILLDDKLKVVVKQDGKKVDSFKGIDALNLFSADHVYSMYPLKEFSSDPNVERISALEIFRSSTAEACIEFDNDPGVYARFKLSFLVSLVGFVYHPVSHVYTEVYAIRSVQYDKSEQKDFEIDAKGETIQHTWWHQYGTTYEPSNIIEKKNIKRFTKNFLK